MAELATDPAEQARYLTFVVIGAGPTGVELVGQLAELAHQVLPRDYRSAVTDSFGMKFTGVIGYTMWGFVHVLYLIDWGNRLATMYTWARALTFAKNRAHRVITFEQARYELNQHATHGEIPGGPGGCPG